MSLNRILPDDIEYFQLETNPKRLYTSSSVEGVTGSVYLYARRSQIEKDLYPSSMFSSVAYKGDETVEAIRTDITHVTGTTNVQSQVQTYMSAVHTEAVAARLSQQQQIYRFVPPPDLNSDFLRKSVIKKTLYPWYRTDMPTMNWNATNFNSLNFFRSDNTPTSSVLIYPNATWEDPSDFNRDGNGFYLTTSGSIRAQYELVDQFTFDFWIKPRNYQILETDAYHAGTIVHMSGAYCISLHSGSSKDENGFVDKFRLCFQYGTQSGSNYVDPPSQLINGVDINSGSDGIRVWTSDNILSKDTWHHVTVRHGGNVVNNGTGSIFIDSTIDTYFSTTLLLPVGNNVLSNPWLSTLFVGNFFEGYSGSHNIDNFTPASTIDDIQYTGGISTYTEEFSYNRYITTNGETAFLTSDYGISAPYVPSSSFAFNHPLNAEIHDLKIYDKYLDTNTISDLQTAGPTNLNNLRLFIPPFFTYESPIRSDELLTPFQTAYSSSTTTPFGATMAFSVWGHNINLENYCRDFASGMYPRMWDLSGSALSPNSQTALSANDFLYATGSITKRLYTVMPCDHGNFAPTFNTLSSSNYNNVKFRDDLGNYSFGTIDLNNIVSESASSASIALRNLSNSQSIVTEVVKARPESIMESTGSSLAILHRTGDTSSNQVVIFDISNLFYGKQIKPGTLELIDSEISGSNFDVKLKDDGNGNLYRANSSGSNGFPTWATVGNVFYNEGLIVLKSPQLYFFGENQFSVKFNGLQNVHVMSIRALAKAGDLISSSNPTWKQSDQIDPTLANEYNQKFVNITGVNIHDENLNVIMRTNLAQPVQKKITDKMVVKIKIDY